LTQEVHVSHGTGNMCQKTSYRVSVMPCKNTGGHYDWQKKNGAIFQIPHVSSFHRFK